MRHWRPGASPRPSTSPSRMEPRRSSVSSSPRTTPASLSATTATPRRSTSTVAPDFAFIESWHVLAPGLDALADRVRGTEAHVVFTAHAFRRASSTGRSLSRPSSWSRRAWSPSGPGSTHGRSRFRAERDRRAVARARHPRAARRTSTARGRARPRLPDRLRHRPPGDPVGHRRRGAASARPSSASSSIASSR